MALTETTLKAAHGKACERIMIRSDRDGLNAKISRSGKISWLFRYRWAGKQRGIIIGTYPATGLKAARDEALRLRGALEQNRDPAIIRRDERAAAVGAITVEELIRDWLAKYCEPRKKSSAEITRSYEIHVFPAIGHQPHDQTPASQWFGLIEQLNQIKPGIARRILINTKQAHSWAARRKMTDHQPLAEIGGADVGIQNNTGKRIFSDDEINILFRALELSRMAPKYKIFIQLCLLFACRTGELSFARKDHFDFDAMVWTVPPELHKTGKDTGRPIKRPIIPAACELLRELFSLSPTSAYAITKKGHSGPLGRVTLTDLPEGLSKIAQKRLNRSLSDWSLHDLRRTARTNLSSLTAPHVAETMLGHTLPGLLKVYDHNDYLDEQRLAYGRWWAKVESLAYGAGKVTPFRTVNSN